MSRGHWLRHAFAWAVGACLLAIIGAWGWNLLAAYRAQHANERTHASQYKHDSANGVVIECLSRVDPPSFTEGIICLANAIEANREAKRSDYDLKAQQEMAEWAFGMLLVSIAGLAVTTIGVLFVLQSLRLARAAVDRAAEANRLSQEAIIVDQRAWIVTELILDGDLEITETGMGLGVRAVHKNIGKTPALNVHTHIDMIDAHLSDIKMTMRSFCNEHRVRDIEYSRVLLPNDSYARPWGPVLDWSAATLERTWIQPVIIGCVTYEVLNDDKLHQTAFVYSLTLRDEEGDFGGFIDTEKGRIPKGDLLASVDSGGFAD